MITFAKLRNAGNAFFDSLVGGGPPATEKINYASIFECKNENRATC